MKSANESNAASVRDAVALIVDGCVEACREFDRETLEAVANHHQEIERG